jgi:hypothetical protein
MELLWALIANIIQGASIVSVTMLALGDATNVIGAIMVTAMLGVLQTAITDYCSGVVTSHDPWGLMHALMDTGMACLAFLADSTPLPL